MIYYRIALRVSRSGELRWKSSPQTSLTSVLGILKMYRCMPQDHMRVFLFSSTEYMDELLNLANQGLPSTDITVDQLWDGHCVNRIEVRRLELEVGVGGDHDLPYSWNLPLSGVQALAWTKLLARRERGELVS